MQKDELYKCKWGTQTKAGSHSSASRFNRASSSNSGSEIETWRVDLWDRARTPTTAARENIATTPKTGKAHAGTMLDSAFGIAACCTGVASLASYFCSVGGAVSQGLEGVGTGTGTGTFATGAQGLPGVGGGVGAGVGGGTY